MFPRGIFHSSVPHSPGPQGSFSLPILCLALSSAAPRRPAGETTAQQCPVPSSVLENCLINNQEPAVGENMMQAGVQLTVTLFQKVSSCIFCQQGSAAGSTACLTTGVERIRTTTSGILQRNQANIHVHHWAGRSCSHGVCLEGRAAADFKII